MLFLATQCLDLGDTQRRTKPFSRYRRGFVLGAGPSAYPY